VEQRDYLQERANRGWQGPLQLAADWWAVQEAGFRLAVARVVVVRSRPRTAARQSQRLLPQARKTEPRTRIFDWFAAA